MIGKTVSYCRILERPHDLLLPNNSAPLGDEDKAFELLDSVCEKRLPGAVGLRCLPLFHCLHGDLRFKELARKIGFPVIPGPTKN